MCERRKNMAEVSIDLNMVEIVDIRETDGVYPEVLHRDSVDNLKNYHMKKGDKLCLDFGDHQVGYVTLKLASVGSPQDAPAFFKLKFGEIAKEMTEKSEDYDGWISRGWIQEEWFHIDVLPATLVLPRRYAFRYLEIEPIVPFITACRMFLRTDRRETAVCGLEI